MVNFANANLKMVEDELVLIAAVNNALDKLAQGLWLHGPKALLVLDDFGKEECWLIGVIYEHVG